MATRPGIFKWRQTEPVLILCAVRWYLQYPLPLRDVEELPEERGLEADHTTVWRWVQRYGPEVEQRMRPHLKPTNKSWRVDETCVRVKGRWCYLYRAIDSSGASIDFLAIGVARCCGGQMAVPQGAQRSVASPAPCHQHRRGCNLQVGDPRIEIGRGPAAALPTPAGPILEQHPGGGSSSDQTAGESEAGVSRISSGAAND